MRYRADSVDNVTPGMQIRVNVDGQQLTAWKGQTIAAVLIQHEQHVFRHTRHHGSPRGMYCGMGSCFDCVVQVNGRTERACMTRVEDGMNITLPKQFGVAGS